MDIQIPDEMRNNFREAVRTKAQAWDNEAELERRLAAAAGRDNPETNHEFRRCEDWDPGNEMPDEAVDEAIRRIYEAG